MAAYKHSLYYEIAFSFVDVEKQVDLFEKFIEKYSEIKVKRILDIACGPSLQLREIAKRGYEAIGLDLNIEMLDYLNQKSREEGIKLQTVNANMTRFSLRKKADFAFIMMGSFVFKNNDELIRHLRCVSKCLNTGGLYLIENLCLDWTKIWSIPQNWTMEKNGIKIETTYKPELINVLAQTYEEKMTLDVNDNGKRLRFVETDVLKYVFPQEFLSIVKLTNQFEFLGLFERFRVKKLKEAKSDNIIILRKKSQKP